MNGLVREYGDISHFKVGRRHVFLLSHPDFIEEVLITGHRNFIKGQRAMPGLRFLGDGLLTSEGGLHNRRRRIIQPAFDHRHVDSYGEIMTNMASSESEKWRDGGNLDICQAMTNLTLRMVARTLFGSDLALEASDIGAALTMGRESFSRATNPVVGLLDKLPISSNRRFRDAEKRLNSTVFRIIGERRTSGEEGDDLLSMLIGAKEEDGTSMTDSQLRDEVMTMLVAGYETTSNALTWAWYLLSQNPAAEEELHTELHRVLSGRLPRARDVPELKYTAMILSETMRLYPPVWLLARKAVNDCTLKGYFVPAGSTILMSQYTMLHDPRYYREPESFRPGRWTPEGNASLPKFAYSPFGEGPRGCIGEPFAWMEGVLLIATIAQRWKMRLMEGHQATLSPGFTLRPKYGMRMIMTQRNDLASR